MNQLSFTYQLKKGIFLFVFFLGFLAAFTACSKKEAVPDLPKEEPVLSEISFEDFVEDLKKITALGFDPLSIERTPRGYLVEGDILLTKENLNASFSALSKQQGQYATRYPVAVVRTIKVSLVDATHSSLFSEAFDSTLARMNAVRLPLKFVKEADTSKADMITSFKDLGGVNSDSTVTLAQASDFVSPEGNPGKYLSFNSHPDAGWRNTSREYITGVWCHEFGHAIGLRHTDYRNRIYSLLTSTGKEFNVANQEKALIDLAIMLLKQSGLNWNSLADYQKEILKRVIRPLGFPLADENLSSIFNPDAREHHIYGTPLSPLFGDLNSNTDPASLMLAYANNNNLKFSNYDHIALYGIYGNPAQTALIRSSLSETGEVTDGTKTLGQIVAEVKALGRKD
jgi:hypothetical protein